MEPYAFTETTFTTLETPQSAAIKANWILENNYAGAMIWDISQDVMDDYSQPLLDTLSVTLLKLDSSNPQGIAARGTRYGKANRANASANRARPAYIYDALGHEFLKKNTKKAYFNREL